MRIRVRHAAAADAASIALVLRSLQDLRSATSRAIEATGAIIQNNLSRMDLTGA